jgi:hypothetical protein
MKFFATLLLPIVAIFIFNSCTTSTGVVQQGDIIGRVYLGSANISPKNEAGQSITVTLIGNTSYSAVSADSGKFVFDKVIQGIYTVTYSKAGYISNTLKNVQFVGNGTLELSTVYLRQDESFGKSKSTFGKVRLYDENGDSLSDHSGAMVSIAGTSISAISDPTGAFYFPKYPAGKFDVTFSKSGYQTFTVPKVAFPDSNSITTSQRLSFQERTIVALSVPPKFEIQFDSVLFNSENGNGTAFNDYFLLNKQQDGSDDTLLSIAPIGRILPAEYGKQISIVSVFGDTPDVNIDTYDPNTTDYNPSSYLLNNPGRIINGYSVGFSRFVAPQNRWHVLRAGKDVYVKIYARWYINDGALHYFQIHNQQRIGMTGYLSSKAIKVTLPTTYRYR